MGVANLEGTLVVPRRQGDTEVHEGLETHRAILTGQTTKRTAELSLQRKSKESASQQLRTSKYCSYKFPYILVKV